MRVYTFCHSKHSDEGLHYLTFSAASTVSTLFAILSSLIRVYNICHSRSDQCLHYLPFPAVWSRSPLLSILSSLIKVYTICHSQQSDQGLHFLRFSAAWSMSRSTLSFSGTVLSRSTPFATPISLIKSKLFAFLISVIWVYTIFHSQRSDQGLHCLPFSAVWSGSIGFCHSQQSDQCLHNLSFTDVWSGSTLFAFLSSQMRVYTVWHSQQFDQGLHFLPFSAWSGSTLFAILSSLIRVYTTCHFQQSD